ncbi:MAG: helix-turn-helix transcriptional regulator [Planctomycetaceae bacterium]|nr:helix-turn-helix transcriptional regulator [Planctomycetales bacterium]MCB9920888.1 helix-turn-helix transcriptional regulator [Planctomycetaceae bacterium]
MEKSKLSPELQARHERLAQVIGRLTERGQTQRQIASSLNVPAQYLSDVKNGQRTITEPFARRIADVYKVSFSWLMDGEGQESIPQFSAAPGTTTSGVTLPVLTLPVEGDPAVSPDWDGSQIIVAGAAAAIASSAKWPYVLRYDGDDGKGRLETGDLLLVTETGDNQGELMIVKVRGSLRIARNVDGDWHSLQGRQRPLTNLDFVGLVRGMVWAPFR